MGLCGRLNRWDDVLLDTPHAGDVLGGDAQRPSLLFRLVCGEPEMHHSIPNDYVRCPDLEPILSLEPFLSHQFRKQLGADGAIVVSSVSRGVALRRRQGAYEVRPADDAHE